MKSKKPNIFRSLGLGLGILVVLIIYAYGFQVTKVDLAETKSEHRQGQLIRIIRALAKPAFFEYEREEFEVTLPIMIPCPETGFNPPEQDTDLPYVVMTPACVEPRGLVTIEGYNFDPLSTGPLNFLPAGSEVKLQLGTIEADKEGYFVIEDARIRNRPSEEVQYLSAITRKNIGTPSLTRTAMNTWEKIVETVFLALLATTIGTILAIPLSFFAARNLMKDITNTLIGTSMSILFIPVGLYLGLKIAEISAHLSSFLTDNLVFSIIGLIAAPVIIVFSARIALPQQELSKPTLKVRAVRIILLVFLFFVAMIGLYLLSSLAMAGGLYISEKIGVLGFLGTFVRDLGDILGMIITLISAFAVVGVFSSLAGKVGIIIGQKSGVVIRLFQILLSSAAGAMLFLILMAGLNWLYEFNNYINLYIYASGIGGFFGLLLGLRVKPKASMPTGLIIYTAARTIFNALRSIEALIMVIIFVVWVGIGPFAGSLALALHTIAALAKLYSEQVESIMEGPVEAVKSTGATRLQTIIYGVIPQIVPPYISFTMYRWDINVRMSTIIGFAGGGGIGFLLQQNINLLHYRDASAQMVAIAVVVALLDYVSSVIRQRIV
jgi:phosphonate ABC transporter permease subunit PhnE